MNATPWWETDRSWVRKEAFAELVATVREAYPIVVLVAAVTNFVDEEKLRIQAESKIKHQRDNSDLPAEYATARERLRNTGPGTEPFT